MLRLGRKNTNGFIQGPVSEKELHLILVEA
jgi:hypothetical protein